MCHECEDDDEFMQQEEHPLDGIPEHEVEEFLTYASDKFAHVIKTAEKHDVLYELITEWPKAKQAAFTLSSIIQGQIFEDDN
jgi:hypothetical protein